MKKFVYLLPVFAALLLALYFSDKSEGDIIAFGDSLTVGVGSSQGGGFVSMLSEDLDVPIVNLGVSGDTTEDALERIEALSGYEPGVVILLLGGNDFLQQVPVEETFNNLERIIVKIRWSGAKVLLLGLDDERFDVLAEKLGTAYVPDILEGIYGNPALMSDSLHPNDAGYRIMADRAKKVLKDLL